jgi:phage terminase large subunit-like protein
MIKPVQVIDSGLQAETGSNRLISVLEPESATLFGSPTPRIHTPLNDLPSRGFEVIDLAAELKVELMPWQKFVLEHSHKVSPDGRWATPLNCVTVARQNGKSYLMNIRILAGLFLWDESIQIGSAHRLSTSFEQFRHLERMIEGSDFLSKQVKKIRRRHGEEEIETMKGNRFIIRAAGSASRGVSAPETIHLDELREMKDLETFASLRYTLMAAKNPMVMAYTNAGESTSLILNQIRERALARIAGADDSEIGYFEWSAPTDVISLENATYSNPALGHTIHAGNIKSVLNDDPTVVMTEVMCRWVQTITGVVDAEKWKDCGDPEIDIDPEKLSWLAIDVTPDRKQAALVIAQKLGSEDFVVKLLHTWTNDLHLDDRAIANDIAPYCRKYPLEYLLYSQRAAGSIATRLRPAGIPIFDMDSAYPQSCDELLGAINSGRLKHRNQGELTAQILSAVKFPRGEAGWVIGRRGQAPVCAAVATALVSHFATRPETEIDILVG